MADQGTSEPPKQPKQWRNHFNDPTLSDLVITFGDNEKVYVHRVILSSASQYFDKLITGHFREKGEKEIALHDDEPMALKAMLRFLYDLPYADDGPVWVVGEDGQSAIPHAQVFVVAHKYGLGLLEKEACKSIRRTFHRHEYRRYYEDDGVPLRFKARKDFWVMDLVQTANTIYEETLAPNEATELILEHCLENFDRLREEREFQIFIRENGALAADLVLHNDLQIYDKPWVNWECANDYCNGGSQMFECPKCSQDVYVHRQWKKQENGRPEQKCLGCFDRVTPVCTACRGLIRVCSFAGSDSE